MTSVEKTLGIDAEKVAMKLAEYRAMSAKFVRLATKGMESEVQETREMAERMAAFVDKLNATTVDSPHMKNATPLQQMVTLGKASESLLGLEEDLKALRQAIESEASPSLRT